MKDLITPAVIFTLTALTVFALGMSWQNGKTNNVSVENFGAFNEPFEYNQLASNTPSTNDCLIYNGSVTEWASTCGSGGAGGSGLWDYGVQGTDVLAPIVASTSNTARVTASSFHATSTATSSTFSTIDLTQLTISGDDITDFNGNGLVVSSGVLSADIATATALAANGSNCSAGSFPLGVDASGVVETCTDAWTEAENTSAAYVSTLQGAFDGGQSIIIADTDNQQLSLTQNDTTNNLDAFDIANAGTGHALHVTQTGNTSASNSVGGSVLITNTSNTGPGLVIYSNQASSAGDLMNLRVDNATFAHSGLKLDYDGAGDGLTVAATAAASNAASFSNSGLDHTLNLAYTGTAADKGALNITSTNASGSPFQVTGPADGLGLAKLTHNEDGTTDSSILSLAASNASYAGQGIFLDMNTTASNTQKLLNLRADGTEVFTLFGDGNITADGILTTGSTGVAITTALGNLDGTKVANADLGELTVSGGSWTIDDSLAVTSWNFTTPTLTSFFGTPCSGQDFLQDISDTGAFTCGTATGGGGSGTLATTTEKIGPGASSTVSYVTDEFMLGGSASTSAEYLFDYLHPQFQIRASTTATTTILSTDATEAVRLGEGDEGADNQWLIGTGIEWVFQSTTAILRGVGTSAVTAISTALNWVFTGLVDIGDGVLEIPNGTGPTANDPGELAHDTSDNQLILDDRVIRTSEEIFKTKIASTTALGIGASSTFPVLFDGYTVTDLACYVEGGTSKVIHAFGETITCATTVTQDDGAIASGVIAALATTSLELGTGSGTWNWLNITVNGVYTRE